MAAPVWRTRIVYFAATGAGAALNIHDGVWITAVATHADGQAYASNAENRTRAVAQFGAGELRSLSTPIDIPADAEPLAGWYDETDGVLRTTRKVRFPLRVSLGQGRALREGLKMLLRRIGGDYPSADVAKAHDILYRLDQASYLVGRDLVAAGDRSAANRIAWGQASALGPTDAGFDLARPETYFDIAHAVPEPTGPFSIVDLADFSRRTLADAVADPIAVGGPGEPAEPLPSDLRDGAWIQTVNA